MGLLPLKLLFPVAFGVLFLVCSLFAHGHGLEVGFYSKSCPKAESIVRKTVESAYKDDRTVTAPVLRLHFHDCFVRGCDGSVLINSTKTNKAEKDAKPNLTLDGFDVIDAAKEVLEKKCPGKVSCADILALAARDAVSLATSLVRRGEWAKDYNLYEVETGRLDGRISRATEAAKNLPSPFDGIGKLTKDFHSRGLSLKDLAVLSGAHAIGNSHCFSLAKRLRRFNRKLNVDPSLDATYAAYLRRKCKPRDNTTTLEMVPHGSLTFDATYYGLVAKGQGLFHSDAALLRNSETRVYVNEYMRNESSFFRDFGASMVNMGRVGVLPGSGGEIRKKCAFINSY